jgi:hypothetical protein
MSATYPLQWPEAWPRMPHHQRQNYYRFRSSGYAGFSGELAVAPTPRVRPVWRRGVTVPTNLVPERWAPTGAS